MKIARPDLTERCGELYLPSTQPNAEFNLYRIIISEIYLKVIFIAFIDKNKLTLLNRLTKSTILVLC